MGHWKYNATYTGYDSTFDWLGAYLEPIVGHKNDSQICFLCCLLCRFCFVKGWLQFLIEPAIFWIQIQESDIDDTSLGLKP